MQRPRLALGALALAAAIWATAAGAQPGQPAWWLVSGGGGSASGGAYALSASAGQPAAGSIGGGAYTLHSGFWAPEPVARAPGLITYLPLLRNVDAGQ